MIDTYKHNRKLSYFIPCVLKWFDLTKVYYFIKLKIYAYVIGKAVFFQVLYQKLRKQLEKK